MRSNCQIHSKSSSTPNCRLRSVFAAIFGVMSVLFATTIVHAQAQKPVRKLHDDIVLTTARPDNVEIHITYYQQDLGKQTPVVILLHAEGSNRQVWAGKTGFAERLWSAEEGYAVITVDLRKHGQSVVAGSTKITPVDRQRMVTFDMEAVKAFIFKEHMAERLNMNKTGIIATEMSAAVAIVYTNIDWAKRPYDDGVGTPRGQDIRTLLLLSPESKPKGLPTGKGLPIIGKQASRTAPAFEFSMAFFYGTADKKDKRGETRRMHKVASSVKGAEKRVRIQPYPYKYRGTELIGKNNVRTNCEKHMLGFLNDHLKKLTQTPWKDRRSVFDR
jgi:hypothetical protein